ncbi:MAG: hypothetical protein U0903_01570 [Planctomycetales bacterium]
MRNLMLVCGMGLVMAWANVGNAGMATYARPINRTGVVAVRPVATRTVMHKLHRPHWHNHHTVLR